MRYMVHRFLLELSIRSAKKIISPIEFDGIVAVNSTKAIANVTHNHIPGFDEFSLKFPKSVNLVNSIKKI